MAELRSFSIINSAGEELSLMEKNTFGNTPTGLGLELTNTYYQAYGSFITDDITVKQGQFSVEMVYGAMSNKPYAQFHEAVKVLNAPPLILRYDIPDVGTYFRDIQFVSMAKSEIEEATGVLRSACVFDFTSPWYAWQDVNAYVGHYLHNQSKLMATDSGHAKVDYAWSANGYDRFTEHWPSTNLIVKKRLEPGYISGTSQWDDDPLVTPDPVRQEVTTSHSFDDWFTPGSYSILYTWSGNPVGDGRWIGIGCYNAMGAFLGRLTFTEADIANAPGLIELTSDIFPEGSAAFRISYRSYGDGTLFKMSKGIDNNMMIYTISPEDDPVQAYPTYVGLGTSSSDFVMDDYDWQPYSGTSAYYPKITSTGPSAVYPYIYQSDFTSGAPFVRIRNDSLYMGTQDDSPMVVTVSATSDTGPVSNPSWMLYDSDGSLIQQDRYVLTIPVGYQLIVSTDWKNRFAVLHSVSGAEADQDVSAQIDPTVKGFVRAPVGESRLQLDNSTLDQIGDFMGDNIKVQLKEEWLVV